MLNDSVTSRDGMELVFELRELEAAGDSNAGEITVSGAQIKNYPPHLKKLFSFHLASSDQ